MLTVKEHPDHGEELWHYHQGETKEDSYFVLNEDGSLIPSTVCLCFAYEPSECMCGCTTGWVDSWYDY